MRGQVRPGRGVAGIGPWRLTACVLSGGGGASEGRRLNHRCRRRTTKGRGVEAGGSVAGPRGRWGARPGSHGGGGAAGARARQREGVMAPPPAPLEPTASASPPPPAPGRETFASCLGWEQGLRARDATSMPWALPGLLQRLVRQDAAG